MWPIAIIGPISTGCAEESLPVYREVQGQRGRTLHLLPVPTGTDLFRDCDDRERCSIFRMPPSNKKQADKIIKFLEERQWGNKWFLYTLEDDDNALYNRDLERQLRLLAAEQEGVALPAGGFAFDDVVPLESKVLGPDVQNKPDAIVVIGPWRGRDDRGGTDVFIERWRKNETNHGISETPIIVPDYAVPDIERSVYSRKEGYAGVYATFQLRPEALGVHAKAATGSGINSRALISYGYDAASLIDRVIMRVDDVDQEKIIDAVMNIERFEGEAQPYCFEPGEHENKFAQYHVFEFADDGPRVV